ncbi:hypothetical protein CC80DRAFT_14005 [Byssothecium circinans]|uniref:Uncharacterized protein n=1 Tax=Byssothecium circinans TaxID=147558 RepID=A0A6A5UJ93_9PLEO|nr:hypothetical protein CC80DRAFT_14005 [Byssothecium circinans]
MLLTLAKPYKSEFEFNTHDSSPTYSSTAAARFSPKLSNGSLPSHRASISSGMGTPHRGLPPPSAMVSDSGRPPLSSSMGALPAAPSQWQGAEDGMKNWLAAKSEEEKRKQEEEKTRQIGLEIEKRKIELDMIKTSMAGGIPPHLIPIIFAGVGGGPLAAVSAEMLRDYQAGLQNSQQQQAHAHALSQLSPELRRETRLIGLPPPGPFSGQPQTPQSGVPPASVLSGQTLPSQNQPAAFGSSYTGGNLSPRARAAQAAQAGHVGAPTSAPHPSQSQLPRLTTNEIHIQQAPTAPSESRLQNTQGPQQEQASPSIYFHHWVPPTSQQEKTSSSANPPATPSDYISSPKKRKAQGGHQAPPPPTSAPQSYTSPSFSHVSTSSASTPGRRGHARARSDLSSRGEGHVPSMSRRTTVSSQTHADAGAQQRDAPDPRFHQQQRRREESHQPHEHAYASMGQRYEGRGEQQGQATPSMGYQTDSRRSSGPQQHQDRGTAPFPKWEPGDQ